VEIRELRPGLWRWTSRHPDWTPEEGGAEGWEPEVGSVFWEGPDAVVLIDPLVPGDERDRFFAALDRDIERAGRPVAVVLTVFWHERSAAEIRRRYDNATVWADERAQGRLDGELTNPFRPGDSLPGGIEPFEAGRGDEVVLWLPGPRALVAGDVLLGAPGGGVRVCPESWLPSGTGAAELRRSLRPLLDLPIELLIVSHGEPVLAGAREALALALA